MLRVKGVTNAHLEGNQVAGTEYDVDWVEIDDPVRVVPVHSRGQPAPTSNDDALTARRQPGLGAGRGVLLPARGPGLRARASIFFTSTQGGGAAEPGTTAATRAGFGNGSGQVWAYDPKRQKLRVVYQSPDRATLDFPDNITTSQPRHAGGLRGQQSATTSSADCPRTGDLWDIALNRLTSSTGDDRSNDEFAGSTFSPDGQTLFVNIQASRGMTFAIWGPWESIGV